MGRIVDLATGFPGYDARIPQSCALLPAMLTPHGYAAYAVGKWHLTPEDEEHLGARRDRWPLGRGFERFYGFFPGETHQFVPALVHDNHLVEPPGRYEDGYHLTDDLVDHAIELVEDLRNVDVDKPWLLYLATGACHSPHQAPPAWIERYRGRFDGGWDAWREATLARQLAAGLAARRTPSCRPARTGCRPGTTLSPTEQRVYARYMEAFAGFLSHADAELGRLLGRLEALGELDDTLVARAVRQRRVVGGRARSARSTTCGSGTSLPQTRRGGGRAASTRSAGPASTTTTRGAGRSPATPRSAAGSGRPTRAASPTRSSSTGPAASPARGEVRRQYVHAVDIVPTVLEAIGVDPPADRRRRRAAAARRHQLRLLLRRRRRRRAPHRRSTTRCSAAGRSTTTGGRRSPTTRSRPTSPASTTRRGSSTTCAPIPSECHDLAAAEPERLAAMVERWWEEAERNGVLPVDNRPFSEMVFGRPSSVAPRVALHVLAGPAAGARESVAVNVRNRPHTITAHVTVRRRRPRASRARSPCRARCSAAGRSTCSPTAGSPTCYNLAGWQVTRIEAPAARRPPGPRRPHPRHALRAAAGRAARRRRGRRRRVRCRARRGAACPSPAPASPPAGRRTSPPPSPTTEAASSSRRRLHRVEIEVRDEPSLDPEAEAAAAVASQ